MRSMAFIMADGIKFQSLDPRRVNSFKLNIHC